MACLISVGTKGGVSYIITRTATWGSNTAVVPTTQTVRYILGHPLQQHPRQDCMATPVRLIHVSMRVVEEYMTRVPSPRTLVF